MNPTKNNIKSIGGGITAPKGFTGNGIKADIKKSGKKDLALIYSDVPCTAAGVFTTNKVQASCVAINKKRIASGKAQAIIVNSGNANCMTGKKGFDDSLAMIGKTADILGVDASHVLVASTGIIGKPLPMQIILSAIPEAAAGLSRHGSLGAAEGIMTTDHMPKEAAVQTVIAEKTIKIGAIVKGGGMIHPNMATMLCFASTDAAIDLAALRAALKSAVHTTFNMITVDGDMSTNDMVLVLANGTAGNSPITTKSKDFKLFSAALESLFLQLSKAMIKDAEGATKFVEIKVQGAKSEKDARAIAQSIANSNLVKTAIFGEDPNWGRIAAAAGYSGAAMEQGKLTISLGNVKVLRKGMPLKGEEKKAHDVLKKKDIFITVDLGLGKHSATAYTCDLSTEYVTFNSAYHT